MIDTHAHLENDTNLKVVDKIINVSLDLDFSKKYKKVFNAIGYHPYDIKKYNKNKLIKLAKNKKVIAIGEIGLDDQDDKHSLDEQIKYFKKQINLAQELNLPIIIHCRGLHRECLDILPKKIRGVVHCYTSNYKNAKKYLNKRLYISFTGIITYSESYDSLIKKLPLDKILLETDCPFLAPIPYRGQKSEPWMVKFIAEKIAEIKKIDYKEVIKQTTKNTEKLFKP